MENSVNIQVINGRWTINEKPLNQCSIAKKNFFASFVKMRLLKSSICQEPNFKQKPIEVKQSLNYRFKMKLERISNVFLNNESNIENITFEPKND